jgi:hypothetical protein
MREDVPLYATLLADTTFHDFLLACDRDLAAKHGGEDAGVAEARCILAIFGASHVAGSVV